MTHSKLLKISILLLLFHHFDSNAQSEVYVSGSSGAYLYIGNSYSIQAEDDVTIGASGTMEFVNIGSPDFRLKGDFTNSGTFTCGNSTISLNGTASQVLPPATYYNLTLNNTTSPATSAATLGGNISIGGTLTLTSGVLNTNTYTIDLGANGSISESNPSALAPTSYVTGYVKATRNTGSTSGTVTFGGMGLEMTETTQTNNSTVVTRRTGTASVGAGNNSILRYFDITPTVDAALNGSIVLHYTTDELNGQAESDLKIYKSDSPYSTWTKQTTTVNAASNTVTASGISSFSRWTVSNSSSNPLPVQLLDFTAKPKNNEVEITWQTTSEINSDYFILEKSIDNNSWKTIAKVKAAQNSSSLKSYAWTDKSNNYGVSYYRLSQVDLDSSKVIHKVVSVSHLHSTLDIEFNVYPNPMLDEVKLEFLGEDEENYRMKIYNASGQEIYSKSIISTIGTNSFQINTSWMKPGEYIISLENDKGEKMVKEVLKK